MRKCTERRRVGFFIRTKGKEERQRKIIILTAMLIAIALFSAFFSFIISILLTYFSTETKKQNKKNSEAHWMLVGQRFPVPVCHGDILRRFSTRKSFHNSLMKILRLLEVKRVWALFRVGFFFFHYMHLSTAFVNLWFPGSLGCLVPEIKIYFTFLSVTLKMHCNE